MSFVPQEIQDALESEDVYCYHKWSEFVGTGS